VVRSRRAWPRLAVQAGLLLGAAAVVWLLVWLVRVVRAGELSPNDVLANGIGLAGLVLGVVSFREQRRQAAAKGEDDSARLNRAADTLAEAVKLQWEAEAGLRALRQPAPLQLRWETTGRPVAVPIASVAGGAIPWRVVRLHGHLDQVADRYLALPYQRLVVLGEPGAGKTVLALLLTLELLKRRQAGGPVALLVGLAAWNPTKVHLHEWLARRLTEDYPALKHPSFGPDAALELITNERVLPVLDGLDELPEPLRAYAISEIERARADRPLILTCRSLEFDRAVAAGGQVLAAAAVVELVPVSAAEAIEFLRAAAGPSAARWDRVDDHLKKHPDPEGPQGGLAGALSTPLMVALARTIYTLPDRDPGELVDIAIAGGRAAVEGRLLDGFIRAAYASRPSAPGTPAPRLRHPPSPELAGRWLGVLAGHLQQQGTRDLAWWQLRNLLPRRLGLVVGLVGGLVGFVLGLLNGLWFGLVFGLLGGLGVALQLELGTSGVSPARVNAQLRGRVGDLLRKLLFALLGGLLVGLVGGLGVGLVFGLLGGLGVALGLGFLFGLWDLFESPGLGDVAVTPDSVLRGDRALALTRVLVFGLLGGLVFGLLGGVELGLVVGLLGGLVSSAWGKFAIARGWLALRGRLPWRLMAFLDDAHRRGVLRQAGAVYQFRHARLQDHLTATSSAAAPDDPSRILHA
jgi:hypothetical protein